MSLEFNHSGYTPTYVVKPHGARGNGFFTAQRVNIARFACNIQVYPLSHMEVSVLSFVILIVIVIIIISGAGDYYYDQDYGDEL